MAGGGYGTSTEEMQRAGQKVFDVNDQVQGQLSSLMSQLAPLEGAWKGQAATAFQTLIQRWNEDARKLNEALRGIGEAIQGSARTYAQQEEEHSTTMNKITGALG